MTRFILDDFLPYQLAVLADHVSVGFSKHYKERFGISLAEWRVLAHLSQYGSVSIREIHNTVLLEKSKISRAASRLEKNGFLTKSINPKDRRLLELALTDKGIQIMAEMAPIAKAYETEVLDILGDGSVCFRRSLNDLMAAKFPKK
ncbi:MAG: MarR family winged helix-turn-helix transcriptional regulator [Halocynthiibacter sp.]